MKRCFKGSLTDDGPVLKVCSRTCGFRVKERGFNEINRLITTQL